MPKFAVGTTVFMRTQRLRRLLESIDGTDISRVYVADVGETDDRRALYGESFPFELRVLDLDYDAGVAAGRRRIVEELEEQYVLIVDSDNEVPSDATVLAEQLDEQPQMGGIAGSLIEPERGRLFQPAADLVEHEGRLVKSSRLSRKEISDVAGEPFVPFDFVPNVTMFRRDCLRDYCWDPEYRNHKEHIDFFVGHWRQTDWEFGVCPTVFFPHYPGGSAEYESYRYNSDRFERLTQYFYRKWGFDDLVSPHGHWFDTHKVPTDPTKGPTDLVEALPQSPETLLESIPQGEPDPLPIRAHRIYRNDGFGGLMREAAAKVRNYT